MSTDAQDGAQHLLSSFADPEAVARCSEGPRRFVPDFDALHLMTGILLAERAPSDATVLVLGAGGGLELKAMAEAHPSWRFVGVDPSEEMLKLAARTLGPLVERVALVQSYIEDAPADPFDAATCLLTLQVAAPRPCRTLKAAAHPTQEQTSGRSAPLAEMGRKPTWMPRPPQTSKEAKIGHGPVLPAPHSLASRRRASRAR